MVEVVVKGEREYQVEWKAEGGRDICSKGTIGYITIDIK
jgi:hypothetical protein